MLSLVTSGGIILGTAISILINKKFNFPHLKLKSIAKVWLSCSLVSMILITIALNLIGGILILMWGIIKVIAIGLVLYGLYYGWKKIFKKIL